MDATGGFILNNLKLLTKCRFKTQLKRRFWWFLSVDQTFKYINPTTLLSIRSSVYKRALDGKVKTSVNALNYYYKSTKLDEMGCKNPNCIFW